MRRLYISSLSVVIISVLLIKFALIPQIDEVMKISMKTAIEEYNQNLAKGVYYLIQRDLNILPQSKWDNHIQELQKHFGYPLSIKQYRDVAFSAQQTDHLNAGEIVVLDYGKLFWQKAGNSDRVIGMGPFPEIKPGMPVIIMAWISITALIGAVLLVWVFFFWRRLMTVTATTVNFGNGNFDERVKISPRSPLFPLAGAFNSMADRIQGLIKSHKELTNAVSHELRTPISRIRFGLEMLRTAPKNIEKESYAQGIQKDVNELDDLVNELLTYAKFDREDKILQKAEYEIVPWCESLVMLHQSVSGEFRFDCLIEDRNTRACFDSRQMARAVGNMVQNAGRYGNGKVRLTLQQEHDNILIHVDDNGPGIQLEDRKRIFAPFTRLDASRSRDSGGYGLGLAIVKQVAESHGGTVEITDSELGGCRFTIKCKIA